MTQNSLPNISATTTVIAIDGPAASGKSSVGEGVASALNFLYFDTGAMYRAVTYIALQINLAVHDEKALAELAQRLVIEVVPPTVADARQYTVLVDGEDVTWELRSDQVDAFVSDVSRNPEVRKALMVKQRLIAARGRVVMVGRDIGTVVVPEAPLKIYLNASAEVRARRRYLERARMDRAVSYEEILSAIIARDAIDSTRLSAPLRIAHDAIVIDTDNMEITDVIAEVLNHARQRLALGDTTIRL